MRSGVPEDTVRDRGQRIQEPLLVQKGRRIAQQFRNVLYNQFDCHCKETERERERVLETEKKKKRIRIVCSLMVTDPNNKREGRGSEGGD